LDKIVFFRKKIDKLDEDILKNFRDRMEICRNISVFKLENNIPIKDQKRERELYKNIVKKAVNMDLNPTKIGEIYKKIIDMCICIQKDKKNKKSVMEK